MNRLCRVGSSDNSPVRMTCSVCTLSVKVSQNLSRTSFDMKCSGTVGSVIVFQLLSRDVILPFMHCYQYDEKNTRLCHKTYEMGVKMT